MSNHPRDLLVGGLLLLFQAAACDFDRGDRWTEPSAREPQTVCSVGELRCWLGVEECVAGAEGDGEPHWQLREDCAAQGLTCVPGLNECKVCAPGKAICVDQDVAQCNNSGEGYDSVRQCTDPGVACRDGACTHLCAAADRESSNVGCEYWAADLDNARIDDSLNAAAQQFAVVVSNPQPDLAAHVTVEQDNSHPGEASAPQGVANATVPPLGLRVFRLGPREVDGSPLGSFDAGPHTAITRSAYRIKSDVPIIAYQFNPLENANVFSNDASLLKPAQALGGGGALALRYTVLGWPQTLAITDDPTTNSGTNLRSFLTLIGIRPNTRVKVHSTARTVGDGLALPALEPGGELNAVLEPFDVLNLETDGFGADFTGSLVHADQPIVAFSGSEAADAPTFSSLTELRCCADHLEEQLDPVRTAGKQFVVTVSANRTQAVAEAGSQLGRVDQPEYFRVIATTSRGAHIRTNLPEGPLDIELTALGDWTSIIASQHFLLESDQPVMLSSVSPSQEAAGIPRGTPGGDPSLLLLPPIEQYRASYVFLTPDKYAFDFVRIIASPGARVTLDGRQLTDSPNCHGETLPSLGSIPSHRITTCQLGFPQIDATQNPVTVTPGQQNDGVHTVLADSPVGVLVDGFDDFVSYAYAAGTDLRSLVIE